MDLDRRQRRAGRAARRRVRDAERDRVDVEQVERTVELDPVAGAEAAAVRRRAAAVGVGRRVRAGLVDDELDLLVLLADLHLAGRASASGRCVPDALVGVGRADDAEHVAAVRDVAGVGRAGSPSSRSCSASAWPCVSWPSTNVTWTSVQLIAPSSGSVTVTLYWMLVAEGEHAAVDRRADDVTVGLVLPAVITVLVDGRLARGVDHRQHGRVAAALRCRCASGSARSRCGEPSPKSHSKRIESPGSSSQRAGAGEVDRQRQRAVGLVRA